MSSKSPTLGEIDEKIAELHHLREQLEREEAERQNRERLVEARDLLGTLVETLHRLDEIDHVPPRLVEALTDKKGSFNPGLYIKRPKTSERSSDTAPPQSG